MAYPRQLTEQVAVSYHPGRQEETAAALRHLPQILTAYSGKSFRASLNVIMTLDAKTGFFPGC